LNNNAGFEFDIELLPEEVEILQTMFPNDNLDVIKERLIEKALCD